MSFKLNNLLASVEVEASKHKVITSTHEPVLPRDEFTCSYGYIGDLERFDNGRVLIVV